MGSFSKKFKRFRHKFIPKVLRRLDTAQALLITGGASLLLKQKQQRALGKIALGVGAAIVGYTYIPGAKDVVGSLFKSRPSGSTSEESQVEQGGTTIQEAYQMGARDYAAAGGAGAATGGGMCAAPVILEAVCKLCGG